MTPQRLTLADTHAAGGASFVVDLGHELPGHFGSSAAEQRYVHDAVGLLDQSYRGILALKAPGVGETLNRFFSSAVLRLEPGTAQPSCLLTTKGRLAAAFVLSCVAEDEYWVTLYEPMREAFVKALERYLTLSDIPVEDVTADWALLSLQGPRADAVLAGTTGDLVPGDAPPQTRQFASRVIAETGADGYVARGGETVPGGFDLWVPRSKLDAVWARLLSAVREPSGGPVGYEAAEALRVEAGVARHGKDYGDDTFPGEVRWEHALTYDKCYVGQEVVARIRTYGQVSRRLLGLRFPPSSIHPSPGTPVFSGEQEAGTLTSSALSTHLGVPLALASVGRRFWTAPELRVGAGEEAASATVSELPFLPLAWDPSCGEDQ